MIYVEEEFINIFGKKQYRTLLKTNDFDKADKEFKKYSGINKVEIFADGELIAVRKEKI